MGLIEEKAALRTRDVERPTWDVIEEWRIDPTTDDGSESRAPCAVRCWNRTASL
ncbi:MAG: hypothetical protein J4F97_07245 [Pseudomonadales bacterium]|nr:hypothetical protein [Pseudomonadales bacterium]